ncbi:hypothetical protein IW261DRAFT_1143861 [Armillaria novae-zelandiae]|uniref:Uncharacterized protein n=1 Tax=Armillaria novae-zelandiae TaxID=153914 RepID=A0AA39PAT7_9AGAR|nr:hypothetical protein IW261DRAFT_1143861 [Armillaria novae-zelandiae]
MATQTDIPSLTNELKVSVFHYMDAELNSTIFYALLHGIYTGILAATLWNIFVNKCWPIRRAMIVVIILLHALITVNVAAFWSHLHSAFVDNGDNFWTVGLELQGPDVAWIWETGVSAFFSTILADFYIIWFCWMVWGRRWRVVLLPMFSLVSATVSRIINIYLNYANGDPGIFFLLYTSFTLATTLSCTLLVIYRIVTTVGVSRRAEGRTRVYRHFIEVLVQSSALYSISLILVLAYPAKKGFAWYYLDPIAGIMKGIAPTLLAGRITTGRRAHTDGSWQGSVIASASIGSLEQEHSHTSSQDDRPASLVLDTDIEAQRESGVGREPSPTFFPGPSAQSQGVMTVPRFENIPLDHVGDTEGPNRVSVEEPRLGP